MKIKDGFVKCETIEGYVAVTVGEPSKEKRVMIKLNDTASLIWDCIGEGLSENGIASRLTEKYDVTFDDALKSVNSTIQKMKDACVIE